MQIQIHHLADRGVGFGTSGVRATVDALTDEVCFAYASAFLKMLDERGPAPQGGRHVAIGHDLRPSSPRITAACIAACTAAEVRTTYCGALPTPERAQELSRWGLDAAKRASAAL